MLSAIRLVEIWVDESGGADQAICRDMKARSAIERQLLIISEAAVRLNKLDPTAAGRLMPDIDWPGIRGIGNFIRHGYDNLDTSILIEGVRNGLPELREACERALRTLDAD